MKLLGLQLRTVRPHHDPGSSTIFPPEPHTTEDNCPPSGLVTGVVLAAVRPLETHLAGAPTRHQMHALLSPLPPRESQERRRDPPPTPG